MAGDDAPDGRPLLIVVAGRPGSGKTTLAHSLARAVRCPLLCRDEIKEGFVNTAAFGGGAIPPDADRRVYEAFFDAAHLLLGRGVSLIVEAAFQHKLWAPKLEELREIARVRVVLCAAAPDLARSRHAERSHRDPERERFHADRALQERWRAADLDTADDYDPPHLDVPTLTVDTSGGYRPDLSAIVSFVGA